VDFLNWVLTVAFKSLLWPFWAWPPVWGLLFISILSGIILLLLYGRVSNQNKLKEIKRSISAALLEAVIYRHDLKTSLKAQLEMGRGALRYLGAALPPILILMIPCLLILAQVNLFYGAQGLQVGQSAIMRLKLDQGADLFNVTLKTSPGLRSTPPLRRLQSAEVLWRLDVLENSPQSALISLPGSGLTLEKAIPVGQAPLFVPTARFRSLWLGLLYPGEKMIPHTAQIATIKVAYPSAYYRILGLNLHWLLVFALFSIGSGVIASRILGVEI